MRVLAITQIWPNRVEPHRTPFNLQQFKCMSEWCDLAVIDAIAHLPGSQLFSLGGRTPRVAQLRGLPARDTIGGIETHYMRQLYLPKIGVPVAVPLYLASLLSSRSYRALIRDADVLLGTWAYPDGCAAILAARAFGKPCAVKVHGTDINGIAKRPSARAVLERVLPMADALVSVSVALSDELEALGVKPAKIHLVKNGVDKSVFAPRDKREARRALGVPESAPVVLFAGRLESSKGVGELFEAMPLVRARVEGATFVVLGEGEWTPRLEKAAAEAGGRLVVPGVRPLTEVASWLAACDVFTLPSWAEGTPNVVLEALASGRPVVATRVGGIPSVLPEPDAGRLVPAKDARALADALVDTLQRAAKGDFPPEKLTAFGPKSWKESAAVLFDVLKGLTA